MKNTTTREDMQRISSLLGDLIVSPTKLPVSFTYGGKTYSALPEGGCTKSRFLDANVVETIYTVSLDEKLTVRAEIETYRDFPAVEWTLWFDGTGCEASAILENVNAIDLTFPGEAPELITNNGDYYSNQGYTDTITVMTQGVTVSQAPVGGRACNQAFPYQRLLFADHGYSISIGWPGQWACLWEGTEGGAKMIAGQQVVHTVIKCGEHFRTPRMTIVAFEGNLERGINVWRRWYHAHVMPRAYGNIFPNMVMCANGGGGIEFLDATEQQQLKALHDVVDAKIGQELWWIDAGWYPCSNEKGERSWHRTGTWEPDPARFPNGFKPIGDACKEAGLEFIVWFEPERVQPHTWLSDNHPEWMLHSKEADAAEDPSQVNMLLDLSNPECVRWLCEHIDGIIKESGMTAYRQDFNFEPVMHWRDNETEDRQGMVENLYIQGYLAYWDYLLMHNPNLMIDSCASGGRRNDLETMRRAVPFHQTDFGYGHHPIKQKFNRHLYGWIPYFRGFYASWDDPETGDYPTPGYYSPLPHPSHEEFDMFCSFAPMMASYLHVLKEPHLVQRAREMVALYKRIRHHMRGDFYGLTPAHCDRMKWTAWQLDSPDEKSGYIQFFRNNGAPEESLNVKLRALCPCATYIFENGRTGERIEMTGEKAMTEGFTESLDKRHASLWIYTQKSC